jgi:hypothetical protein
VTKEPYERLERNASKVARFVLRRARPGNRSGLSDIKKSMLNSKACFSIK